MNARMVRWVVALAWWAGAAQAGENDWEVTLTGECHEMRPGVAEVEDPIPCPPVCYYGNTEEHACFTMDTTPTIAWDFSQLSTFYDIGVTLHVYLLEWPHGPCDPQTIINDVYGLQTSPLAAADSLTLPELAAYIGYGEMYCTFSIFIRYSGSPWNFWTSRFVTFQLYTVLDAPVDPQEVVWLSALKLSTWWMRFTTDADGAAKQLVEQSWGVDYDDGSTVNDNDAIWWYDPDDSSYIAFHWDQQAQILTQEFYLRDWLDDYVPYGQQHGLCATIACHLTVMLATVGVDADPFMSTYPYVPFAYKGGARRSGHTEDLWASGQFNYHEAMDYLGLYDGCVCIPDSNGTYLVQENQANEAVVKIIIQWQPSAWFSEIWVSANPEPGHITPELVVSF